MGEHEGDGVVKAGGDRHYTPPHIADALAGTLNFGDRDAVVVADFAAGTGSLLEAVEKRFGNITCIGTDADRLAVEMLRVKHPPWRVGRCDFLNTLSVAHSPLARPSGPTIDATVLNPPFSCRGSHTVTSDVLGRKVSSSVAMAFVLRSMERIGPDGQVTALLPAGCLYSEKDEQAWELLRSHAIIQVAGQFGRGEFKGAFADTVLVHLQRTTGAVLSGTPVKLAVQPTHSTLTLYRGRFPMNCVTPRGGGCRLVHTIHLHHGTVARGLSASAPEKLGLQGPLLLIPRVGLPRPDKISLYRLRRGIVLSDCLFALSGPLDLLEEMQRRIVKSWDTFRGCYGGSCAPYTTVRRLLKVLTALGGDVVPELRLRRVAGASSPGG